MNVTDCEKDQHEFELAECVLGDYVLVAVCTRGCGAHVTYGTTTDLFGNVHTDRDRALLLEGYGDTPEAQVAAIAAARRLAARAA